MICVKNAFPLKASQNRAEMALSSTILLAHKDMMGTGWLRSLNVGRLDFRNHSPDVVNSIMLYTLLFDYWHRSISTHCPTNMEVHWGHPPVYILWNISTIRFPKFQSFGHGLDKFGHTGILSLPLPTWYFSSLTQT